MAEKIIVNAPATSANIGVCFDFAGIIIPDLYNTVEVEQAESKNTVTVEGCGADVIPADENCLTYRAFRRAFEYADRNCPFINMHCINRIPLNRGLGSSAAAALAGIFAANKFLDGMLSDEDMLKLACEFEGHPDNAAPAIYGGAVITAYINGEPIIRHIKLPKDMAAAVAIPEILLSTSVARSVLPESYTRKDVVAAASVASLAVDALVTGEYELMGKLIMQDVIHMPYRKSLIKGYDDVVNAALDAGAYGCVISGAGSAMIAFCKNREIAEIAKEAMINAFRANGVCASGLSSIIKKGGI